MSQYDMFFSRYPEKLPRSARMLVLVTVLSAHAMVAWGLMQITPVRQAVISAAPMIFVQWVAPPVPAAEPVPVRLPPKPIEPLKALPKEKKPVKPRPKITSEPLPMAAVTPAAKEIPVTDGTEQAVETTAVPVARPDALPSSQAARMMPPRTVSVSEVRYRVKPAPEYPKRAQRFREQGQALVRVLISAEGMATDIVLDQSSGSASLDQAAITAVQRARFYPYLENGVPMMVWVRIPISFTLKG